MAVLHTSGLILQFKIVLLVTSLVIICEFIKAQLEKPEIAGTATKKDLSLNTSRF